MHNDTPKVAHAHTRKLYTHETRGTLLRAHAHMRRARTQTVHAHTARMHLSVRHFCRAALHYIPMGDVKRLCRARKAFREGGASFEKMLRVKKLADAHLYANEFR